MNVCKESYVAKRVYYVTHHDTWQLPGQEGGFFCFVFVFLLGGGCFFVCLCVGYKGGGQILKDREMNVVGGARCEVHKESIITF